jgi:hypothetical protein
VAVGEVGGRSVVGLLVAALIALVCALALPAVAAAETFEVNSVADEPDAVTGDEFCKTATQRCTLQAAIEEADALPGFDVVGFDEAVFDGRAGGTITPTESLPAITEAISIEGECVPPEEALRPCVGVDGPGPSEPALIVENAEEVEIDGLAITGAETGIEVTGSPRFKALSDWIGVKLDAGAGGNATGIFLDAESNRGRIGSEGVTNVFANNDGDGLDVHGASNVRILGGYFGVRPDGFTPAPNGKDIEVTSFTSPGGEVQASGNAIGTQVSSEAVASPACDGGCNVISGSGSSGIDLEGDGGGEAPAANTTVAGNYIGLDASGTAAVPNAAAGVRVGPAGHTVVGGVRASEANRFAGGEAAVVAGPGAANLVVRGNWVGFDAEGATIAPPEDGIVVRSEGLPTAAVEATIAANEIGMSGGVAIDQQGLGGWVFANRIAGAGTGIRVGGETEEHGNLIQDNLIEGSSGSGVLVESSFNEILGNELLGSGGPGVLIEGAPFSFGVSGNLVGGDTEADENLIADSGGAALEISNLENTDNEVARNTGFANDGLFVDLVSASPSTEPEGPNKGIEPPVFTFASQSGAGGSDAEPEARIRVFRKASAEAGEIESFLGEAVVDEEGGWEVVYGAPIPAATRVAATQTMPGSGTSELAGATVPAAPSSESGVRACASSTGCAAPTSHRQPIPRTKIFRGPKGKKLVKATAAFKFKSDVEGSAFSCKLDGGQFGKCHSPKVYTGLKPGKHLFEVRAANSVGEVDPTPAKLKFTVLG